MLEYGYYNMDCMKGLAEFPDKYFDLAIVDPPYGIKESGKKNGTRSKLAAAKEYKPFAGDDLKPPDEAYFRELFRVSKNQIIFGANHLFQKYRMTALAGLFGTRTTAQPILQTANWRGLPLKPPSADINIHGME